MVRRGSPWSGRNDSRAAAVGGGSSWDTPFQPGARVHTSVDMKITRFLLLALAALGATAAAIFHAWAASAIAKPVSYTHLRAHETVLDLVCRLLLEKKNFHYTRTKSLV